MGCLDLLFLPLEAFVWHPERIFLMAGVLCLLFLLLHWLRRRAWPVLSVAIAWGLWAPWEAYCKAGGFNIRIDLFLIGPVLLIATIGGLIVGLTPRSPD
ncbi:MAG TPA: hypothetical protein VN493_12325 [Thermoanaerobaculia bacterium]|nr:hypothetical protein [Thermoanaerobaculia bacterium]